MDDQQNRRAESGLHAGTEPRNDCEGGDAGRVHGRRFWTPAEDAELTRRYATETAKAIAADIGRGERAVYMRVWALGLSKPATWFAECTRQRWAEGRHENSRARSFAKGAAPFNKGRPLAEWNPNLDACRATQFKPGRLPSEARNYRPIGSLRIGAYGQLERKTTDDQAIHPSRRWSPVSRIVWEAANGPVPPGMIVRFRDGKATTVESEITLDRLELVSRRENMLRNSRHNRYPPEVNQVMQLMGALNRKINNRSKA